MRGWEKRLAQDEMNQHEKVKNVCIKNKFLNIITKIVFHFLKTNGCGNKTKILQLTCFV